MSRTKRKHHPARDLNPGQAPVRKGKNGKARLEDIVPRLIQRKEIGAATSRHSGPYSAEEPTVAALHRFIVDHGLKMRGLHHEIYLSDPGRTAPENMKTIIRQPVE